jgi:hypothetical protein
VGALPVFPKFPGVAWPETKEGQSARTIIPVLTTGKEVRINTWSGTLPIWKFTLIFNYLNQRQGYQYSGQVPQPSSIVSFNPLIADDHRALQGFMMAVFGSWQGFYVDDPNDDSIVRNQIGVGDGTTLAFQVTRNFGAYLENIQNINGTPVLAPDWQPSVAFATNAYAVPTQNGMLSQAGRVGYWQTQGWPNLFQAATGGTTGTTEPNWRLAPVLNSTLVDGGVTWTNVGTPFVAYLAQTALADYQTSTLYAVGTTITPTVSNAGGHSFVCTSGGTSGGATTWGQIIGGSTTTGGATFQDLGVLPVGALYPIVPQLPSLYTLGPTGLLTFASAPLLYAQISVSCGFWFLVHFDKDSESFDNFMKGYWAVKALNFTSIKI